MHDEQFEVIGEIAEPKQQIEYSCDTMPCNAPSNQLQNFQEISHIRLKEAIQIGQQTIADQILDLLPENAAHVRYSNEVCKVK